eukprot:Awhi_evm2s3520
MKFSVNCFSMLCIFLSLKTYITIAGTTTSSSGRKAFAKLKSIQLNNQKRGREQIGVYTLSNQIENSVTAFVDNGDGTLEKLGEFSTKGIGYPFRLAAGGAPVDTLFSQDSILVHKDQLWAVNAGSNSLSVFEIQADMSLGEPNVLSVYAGNTSTPCIVLDNEKLGVVCTVTAIGVGSLTCFDDETFEIVNDLSISSFGMQDDNNLDPFAAEANPVTSNTVAAQDDLDEGIDGAFSIHDGEFTSDGKALMFVSFQGLWMFTIDVDNRKFDFKNQKKNEFEFNPSSFLKFPVQADGPRSDDPSYESLKYQRRPFALNIIDQNLEEDNNLYTVLLVDPIGTVAADLALERATAEKPAPPESLLYPGGPYPLTLSM